MMDMSMAMDDWALFCSLPPAGDQWQYSADQFLEPYDLLGSKSDDAELQPFHDGIIVPNNFNSVWSDDGSFSEGAAQQKSVWDTRYQLSAGHHVSDSIAVKVLEMAPSAWEELPSSPETFGVINNYDLCDEVRHRSISLQQLTGVTDRVFSHPTVASSVTGTDSAVPECELSTDDMLLDLDEAINDVIMDPLKFADFGLYLPPVSADDVESLLSSPFAASAAAPALLPVSVETGSCVASDSVSEYHDEISVAGPVRSEMALSATTPTSLPDEQDQVPSPASSQSSISMPTFDKKRRKKEQNKTAAQKYRQKKRGEQGLVSTEYEQLERRNIELHTRVKEMTREVDYLKGLIEEICA